MSFLCPARKPKQAKKKKEKSKPFLSKWILAPGVGRLTGSNSLDTLVCAEAAAAQGGHKPLMVVVHDFTPCVSDEVQVWRGDTVQLMFQENDWMYVERVDGKGKGFVPYTYCLPLNRPEAGDGLGHEAPPQPGQHKESPQGLSKRWSRSMPDVSEVKGMKREVTHEGGVQIHDSREAGGISQQQHHNKGYSETEDVHTSISGQRNHPKNSGGYNIHDSVHSNRSDTKAHQQRLTQTEKGNSQHLLKRVQIGHTSSVTPSSNITFHSSLQQTSFNHLSLLNSQKNTKVGQHGPLSHNTQPDYPCNTFTKTNQGYYIVLYNYSSENENDLCVERGEFVTLLNQDDPDWFWVRRHSDDGSSVLAQEGFVPASYLCPANTDAQTDRGVQNLSNTYPRNEDFHSAVHHSEEGDHNALHVALYDYKGSTPGSLSIHQGELLQAMTDSPPGDKLQDWVHVYSLNTRKSGLVPRSYIQNMPQNWDIV